MAIMEALVQIEDVEKQSAVIKGETLGEKKEENVEIKTEVKEEYGEPASLSQVKLDPLEIKTEEVKEENVDGIIVCSLIQNEIKREIKTEDLKEEYIEVPDFQQPLRTEGDQIILEPEEAVQTTTCEHCERIFDDVSGLKKHLKSHHIHPSIECPHCDETFSKQAGLNSHVHVIHSDEGRKKQPPALAPLRQTKSPANKKNAKEEAAKKEEAGAGPLEKKMLLCLI